jgi:isopentenyl-diphosphate delta-isomerase
MMIDAQENVILVDALDREIGIAPKLAVHRSGLLHRAFSVFVTDEGGRLLLQRRAESKYHSPGLWSNSCCGHPRPGEATIDAAMRRLNEEMGIQCELDLIASFSYRARLDRDLLEHELDHVFVGTTDGQPECDPNEVDEFMWADVDTVIAMLRDDPAAFTAWFAKALATTGLVSSQAMARLAGRSAA